MAGQLLNQPSQQNETLSQDVRRRLVQVAVQTVLIAVILFLSAGRLDWVMAWVYMGLYLAAIIANAIILLPRSPEMIAERGKVKADAKGWDLKFGKIYLVVWLATYVTTGLNVRYGWLPEIPVTVVVIATVFYLIGSVLFVWAMASNRFFSAVVRIQKDRGHTVETGGPYHFVRHPGYAGLVISTIATPLMLGSLWALVPGVLAAGALIVRTALEDKTLHEELDGYHDYARQTRYRLLPGVW